MVHFQKKEINTKDYRFHVLYHHHADIHIHNDKEFDAEILHFAGGQDRLSTKYSDGSCPYSFVIYFFNNSQRLKSISIRSPQQYT